MTGQGGLSLTVASRRRDEADALGGLERLPAVSAARISRGASGSTELRIGSFLAVRAVVDREALVLDSISLVERLALGMAGHVAGQVELADLIQSGFVGLLDAASKFDRNKGARFSTYAEFRIKGAMLDSLRSLDWAPRSVRRVRRRLETVERRLEARLGRPPREDEVAAGLGVALAELRRTIERIHRAESAYQRKVPVEEFISIVSDPNAVNPHEMLERLEAEALLARSIQDLPERERLVLSLYYYDELTMRQVGAILGVNESRISQIHSRVLSKLRLSLARGDAKPRLTPRRQGFLSPKMRRQRPQRRAKTGGRAD